MNVLGIESSCDETAAAVVRPDGEVISDVVASQIAEHAPYGGVVPELASRAHLRAILPVIDEAVAKLPGGLDDIDAVAVTNGPGLVGALLVGLSAAKAIAWSRGLPIVGVDHLDGHLLAVHLHRGGDRTPPPPMPYIALLASGGHTALYEVRSEEEILLLGQTRDDAAGEAFDKVAKVLGLGYPGGPVIDGLAAVGDPSAIEFPRPMARKNNIDFSFSGLKTSVAYHIKANGAPKDDAALADICASFQRAMVDSLVTKALNACEMTGVQRLVLTGGVAANRGLRQRAEDAAASKGVTVHVPPLASCTDNAAMIAYVGARRLARGERDDLDIAPYSRAVGRKRGKVRA